MEYVECEVWVKVNENKEYEVAKSADDVHEFFADNGFDGGVSRTVKATVCVPRPKAAEVTVTVGEEPGDVTATV